ncbi:MAG: hypothetical protein AAB308_09105 [Nitrospirota bacterium]|jgi:hypothetical protein
MTRIVLQLLLMQSNVLGLNPVLTPVLPFSAEEFIREIADIQESSLANLQ